MKDRAQTVVTSIGIIAAVGAVTAAVTVGVIAGIRHFGGPSTTPTTAHVAPEADPASTVTAPTSEECVRIRALVTEDFYEWIVDRVLSQATDDPQSSTTSILNGASSEPPRVLSDEELGVMDACYRATEAACAPLSELVAIRSAPTADTIADCSVACETYRAAACKPPCLWGLFGFGELFDEDAPGGCSHLPICDPASDAWLTYDRTLLEPPWDLPPPGWEPPTPECVPICDIDRDGFATARDYAGECAEVAAWLEHDCETQVAPYRALDRSLGETVSRSMAACHDADLASMATLPPTIWQDASIIHRSSSASEVLGKPPNIDLLTRYRCAGRLTDPCIDYSR